MIRPGYQGAVATVPGWAPPFTSRTVQLVPTAPGGSTLNFPNVTTQRGVPLDLNYIGGGFNTFTLVKAGLWMIDAEVELAGAVGIVGVEVRLREQPGNALVVRDVDSQLALGLGAVRTFSVGALVRVTGAPRTFDIWANDFTGLGGMAPAATTQVSVLQVGV